MDSLRTLADLAKLNDANVKDLDISDLLDEAPLVKVLPAAPASNGTTHKYLKKITAPTVGFRPVNGGRDQSKSGDDIVSTDCKYLDGDFTLDVAYCKGHKGGVEAAIAKEAKAHFKALMFAFETQLINGGGDGFSGFKQAVPTLASSMVVNAGGAAANTGSSVYLIRAVPDESGVCAIMGNDGSLEMSESSLIQVRDGDGKAFAAYLTSIGAWLTAQVGTVFDIGRIVNLTAEAGKGLTDSLIYDALALFPASKQPTHIVMNRRSLAQLRKSRTATNATGAPAPRPTEVDGIPIVTTDAIPSTEAILAA